MTAAAAPAADLRRLLAAAADGDATSWSALVDRFSGLLWSIARGYRLSTADAADVVQTTWLRLVEHLDRIDDPDRLASWLATTTRRECLQALRRGHREAPDTVGDRLEAVPDPADPLDATMLREERDAELWLLFESLSDRCRRLLRVLCASPPPAYAEVAAALDMPVGSIGPTRARCLDRLRALAAGSTVLGDEALGDDVRGVDHPAPDTDRGGAR